MVSFLSFPDVFPLRTFQFSKQMVINKHKYDKTSQ